MKLAIIGSGNIGKSIGAWAASAGYEVVVDAGPLTSAREIEPLGMLNIKLGFKQGLGTGIGFSLLR